MNIDTLSSQLKIQQHPIPIFKEALNEIKANLAERFHDGCDVNELMSDHASYIDGILRLAWQRFDWEENRSSWRKTRISLVAVGGYGRAELHPCSDIDLLILLEGNTYQKHSKNIQGFLTLLWDIGLEVGHSVRSQKECKFQASLDVTIVTSLMEARTICGDSELFEKVIQLIDPKKIWPVKKFYQAKTVEQFERHRKFEYTEYSLEPNVKSSPGALRDIQTVMWIAKRQFGSVDFNDLVKLKFLTADEMNILRAGERHLWKIRYGLHLIAKRDENRLLFEHQRELAQLFGYKNSDQLAVEQFMQAYYRTAIAVNATCTMLLQHFEEAMLQSKLRNKIKSLDTHFEIRNKRIEVTSPDVFERHPPALLEIFVHMGNSDEIEGASAETIRLMRQSLHLIDDEFRSNTEVTEIFLKLLRSSNSLFTQLRNMERYGILGTYLPEFGRVIGLMQFDLFHIYTVDAHTLQVVRNMRRFRYKSQAQKFPVAAHIYARLPKIELLFIAGLYHDIAKGLGGDHSELGIDIARKFCERHQLGNWDTNLVCWLVKNHLTMSSTAQRKDITDPSVIHDFALLVMDQVRLDYLYALTVADINATNPTLWNSWRASLMRQLYLETKRALRQGLENYVDRPDYISETQSHAIFRLEEHGLTKDEIIKIWDNVDDEYFVRESVSDIVWHTEAISQHSLDNSPLILVRDTGNQRDEEGATEIFVYTRKTGSQFAAAVNAIDLLGLDIVDARIATSKNGFNFDTFVVLAENGKPVGPSLQRQKQIKAVLKDSLEKEGTILPRANQRTPRNLKQFEFRTELSATNDSARQLTMLEVVTPDRPGLLTIIANIFVELDIQLHNAKITTLGERVEDVFYISDQNGSIINSTDELTNRIRDELDQHIQKK
ncbi:MAG: [protein-PII] uridylyltransferase [Candidatus Azotimanducaceae bacterium]